MRNLVFDYDGTIHNSIKIYAPAFRIAIEYLEEKGFLKPREYSEAEISSWLGFSAKEMWNCLLPELPEKEQKICSHIIGEEMLRLINQGKAELYDYAIETLDELKHKGFNLIFLSNCKNTYMKAHIERFGLDLYFSSFYCSEDYGFKPKYEIFSSIKKRYSGDFVIIGDRFQDMEIAKKHRLPSIGCSYGYGDSQELEDATARIRSLREILDVTILD